MRCGGEKEKVRLEPPTNVRLALRNGPSENDGCMWLSILRLVYAVAVILPASAAADDYDLIVRGGRIVDGSGNPAFRGDVAVKDGKIAAIGRISGNAPRELDARRLVVAPGFIDVHTHAEDIDELPLAENFLRMGVTTLVLGNCGSSTLNVGEFFAQL